MNGRGGSGKKRKADLASHASLEAEKNLYPIFATAANAVTNLYAGAVQSQRAAHQMGSRAALERVLRWVCEHHGGSGAVPAAHLVEMLHEELQARGGSCSAGLAYFLFFSPPVFGLTVALHSSGRSLNFDFFLIFFGAGGAGRGACIPMEASLWVPAG
jgi:hypothetical protein